MITFERVSMSYPTGLKALHEISLHLALGSFHFVTGASGAGKSSLLSLLALDSRASAGRITMFGINTTQLARPALPAFRRRIGLVFQDFQLLDHLSVEDNIGLPLKVLGEKRRERERKVEELLRWIGLSEYKHARPEVLSGGQKQLVAVARAVVHKPDLLLADEPTGNLDPATSYKLMHLFEAMYASGTTVVVATHDEHLISQFSYPVWHLEKGRLI